MIGCTLTAAIYLHSPWQSRADRKSARGKLPVLSTKRVKGHTSKRDECFVWCGHVCERLSPHLGRWSDEVMCCCVANAQVSKLPQPQGDSMPEPYTLRCEKIRVLPMRSSDMPCFAAGYLLDTPPIWRAYVYNLTQQTGHAMALGCTKCG